MTETELTSMQKEKNKYSFMTLLCAFVSHCRFCKGGPVSGIAFQTARLSFEYERDSLFNPSTEKALTTAHRGRP